MKRSSMRTLVIGFVACMLVLAAMPSVTFGTPGSSGRLDSNQVLIPVEQIFTIAPGVERDARFSYELRAVGGADAQGQSVGHSVGFHPLPEEAVSNPYVFSLSGSEVRDIGPLTFLRAGTYVYELRNTDVFAERLLLDSRIYTLVIEVRNSLGGGLDADISSIFVREALDAPSVKLPAADIVFEKGYEGTLEIPSLATIPVVKTVQGNPARTYDFTFRLEAAGDYPMPDGATGRTFDLSLAGGGRVYFPSWMHSSVGTFSYTVREIPSNNSDYVFDTSVYTITDVVSREGNVFSVDRLIATEDNREVTTLSFINTYVGSDIEVQASPPGGGGTTTGPIAGPKTGDYIDPLALIITTGASMIIALFALGLIYLDRRSEKEGDDVATIAVAGAQVS